MTRRGNPWIFAALLGVAFMAACQPKKKDDVVEPAAIDEVEVAVAEELNQPGAAVLTLLKRASESPQIGWDAMQIGFNDRLIPVNWWLWRRGYLSLHGSQFVGRPVFGLSQKARDLIGGTEAAWFEAEAGEPTRVDCNTPAALTSGGCEVELVVTPALTSVGRGALGPVTLAPMTVTALVSPTAEGWEVSEMSAEPLYPIDVALTAMLGPDPTREAAGAAVLNEIEDRTALTPERQAQAPVEAYRPLPPAEDVAPVAPLIGPSPLSPTRGRPALP